MEKTITVRLDEIRIDAGTQSRAAINESVIADYSERMAAGDAFPPIELFDDSTTYHVGDGFHRLLATKRNGAADIEAHVRPGSRLDALWFSLGANARHGHRMTTSDRRHAILLALKTWPTKSQAVIAEQLGCTQQYVGKVKAGLQVTTGCELPASVTGRDGKRYPAARSKPRAEVSAAEATPETWAIRNQYAASLKRKDLPNRIVETTVRQAASLLEGTDRVSPNALDQRLVATWANDLRRAARDLKRFADRLESPARGATLREVA